MADSCSRNTAAGNGQTKHGGHNLTSLPDVVLEHVFKMLPVADRGALASTCSRLSAIMHRPAVWNGVTINLIEDHWTYDAARTLNAISVRDTVMNLRYSRYYRHVTVLLNHVWIAREAFSVLCEFAERGILKNVVLCTVQDLSKALSLVWNTRPGPTRWPSVSDLLVRLTPDTKFTIELPSDPSDLHEGHRIIHFYSCSKEKKCCSLVKSLALLECQISEKELIKTASRLSKAPTAVLVSQFPALQGLELSMGSISDALLLELADASGRRCPLRSLVLRHLEWKSKRGTSVPQSSSAAWGKLVSSCPSLSVECSAIVDRLSPLFNAIKPQTPLVKLKIICLGGKKRVLELFELCKEHSSTLQHFELCVFRNLHSKCLQKELKNMVLACPRIQHLVCDIDISYEHITALARDSRQWRTFSFRMSRVITESLMPCISHDYENREKDLDVTQRLYVPDNDHIKHKDEMLNYLQGIVEAKIGFAIQWSKGISLEGP